MASPNRGLPRLARRAGGDESARRADDDQATRDVAYFSSDSRTGEEVVTRDRTRDRQSGALGAALTLRDEGLSLAAASALRSHLLLDSAALFALLSPDKEILADERLLDEAKSLMAQDKEVTWLRCPVCRTEYVEKDNGPQSCPGMPGRTTRLGLSLTNSCA